MFIDQGISPTLLIQECKIIHYQHILNVIYYNREKRIDILHNLMNKLFHGWACINKEDGLKNKRFKKCCFIF